jgi:hypothetical protein
MNSLSFIGARIGAVIAGCSRSGSSVASSRARPVVALALLTGFDHHGYRC